MVLNLLLNKGDPPGADVRTLRRSRQADLGAAIVEVGLQPKDFGPPKRTYSPDTRTKIFPVLVHAPTNCYFIFGGTVVGATTTFEPGNEELFESIYEPGINLPRERVKHATWADQLKCFRAWLAVVKSEADPTDIWAPHPNDPARQLVFDLDDQVEDEPFSASEQTNVSAAWREIEERLTTLVTHFASCQEELARMPARFHAIERKMQTQNKRDWVRGALYSLIGMVVRCGLDALGVTRFLTAAAATLARAFGLDVPLVDDHSQLKIGD